MQPASLDPFRWHGDLREITPQVAATFSPTVRHCLTKELLKTNEDLDLEIDEILTEMFTLHSQAHLPLKEYYHNPDPGDKSEWRRLKKGARKDLKEKQQILQELRAQERTVQVALGILNVFQ